MVMEIVSKSWEESYMRKSNDDEEFSCVEGNDCCGKKLFDDNLILCDGFVLTRFVAPSGRRFDQCVLCLRRSITREWYEIMGGRRRLPDRAIHPYTVITNRFGEYSADVCLCIPTNDPWTPCEFFGLTGPFPKYNPYTLMMTTTTTKDGGGGGGGDRVIRQINMEHSVEKSFVGRTRSVGARKFQFYPLTKLYDVSNSIPFCGLIGNVHGNVVCTNEVIDFMRRSLFFGVKNDETHETRSKKMKRWLTSLCEASLFGSYLSSSSRYSSSSSDENVGNTMERFSPFFVRDHVVFLVENDSELKRAVVARYGNEEWRRFVDACVRAIDEIKKRKDVDLEINDVVLSAATIENKRDDYETKRKLLRYKSVRRPNFVCAQRRKEYVCTNCDSFKGCFAESFVSKCLKCEPSFFTTSDVDHHDDDYDDDGKRRKKTSISTGKCTKCRSNKYVLVESNDDDFTGSRNVVKNLITGELECFKPSNSGRKPLLDKIRRGEDLSTTEGTALGKKRKKKCDGTCLELDFGANWIHLSDGACYTVCTTCDRIFPITLESLLVSNLKCAVCSNTNGNDDDDDESSRCCCCCDVCGRTKSKSWIKVKAFRDGGLTGVFYVWFCKNHSFSFLKKDLVWSYPILHEKAVETDVEMKIKKNK